MNLTVLNLKIPMNNNRKYAKKVILRVETKIFKSCLEIIIIDIVKKKIRKNL